MAEEKKTLTLGDQEVSVTELEIVKRSGESVAEYLLEDESVIRVANAAAIVYRMNDSFDTDGNPFYLVKIGTSVTTVKAPKQNKKFARKNDGKTGS
ncbi:MAG: hypothetical protein Q7S58_12655 [Candidatus Binatus sp.]|uniref:hypothetical protein n=1 Tax=Candidatus Binatus sp. TaxID=2811406 RepID=UPI002723E387|nr:hypothetical protein [Candidatus Binatus sp.]MDO8433250.1 hypothetical protein [Candidatus Binatus sp.]